MRHIFVVLVVFSLYIFQMFSDRDREDREENFDIGPDADAIFFF